MYKFTTNLFFTVLAVLLTAEVAMAQVPQGFNFQAVARDSDGELIANTELGVQVSILEGAEDGSAVYTETQTPETNNTGQFNLVIGEGESEDDFGAIDWAADNYYVKLEIDPAGGDEYEELGTTRLLSVPYAMLAQDVVNGGSNGGSDLSLPLDLRGPNNNMSVTLGSEDEDNNYGFLGLGNADGDTLGQMYVANFGDTVSQARMNLRDSFGRFSYMSPSEVSVGNSEEGDGFRSRLLPNNLYFINPNIDHGAPPAWFGTYQGSGFYQMLDFSDTGTYEGGILSGFWAGFPSLVLEDGDETPLVLLEGQKHEDRNIGVITLRGTDGSEFQITSDGFQGGGSGSQQLLVENEDGEGVVTINPHGAGNKQGMIHLYGETETDTDNLRAQLEVHDNGNGDSWGFFGLKGPVFDDNGGVRSFVEAFVSNDPEGSDPDGWSGNLNMWGTDSPNIQMGGKQWENADVPSLTMFGNKPNEDNWYYSHINLDISQDGDNQWGSVSLDANNGVPNFNFGAPGWENAELADMQMFGNTPNPEGGYYSNINLSVHEDENNQQWGFMQFKEGEDNINMEFGAKSWEDPTDGAGRPYMSFRGNGEEAPDMIYLDVAEDGGEETGQIQLNSTDGAHFSINAHGINSNTNINGNLHVDGDITHTGSISQSSDRRLKENIQPLQNGLGTIMKLNPTTYNFRGNGDYNGLKLSTGLHYGLIAQEVEEVLPSLVKNNVHTYSETTSTGSGPSIASETEITKTMEYKTLNYTELVPVLVKAVQEQQQEIKQLREEVEQLKEERKAIEQLRKDVEELKNNQ